MEGDAGDQEQKEPVAPASRSTPVAERSHALHVFTGRLTARLDELGSVLTATMTESERAETLAELVRCQDRFAAVIATLIADDPNAVGTLGASANLTARTRRRLARRSRVLAGHPQVHAALASGQLRTDQAQVITTAVDRLPEEVAHLAKEAENHLLELALDHDADELKNLAKHLLHVIAPDQADELLAKQLEKEERDARRTAFLKIYRDGQGSTWVKGKIPDLHGQILQTLLHAVANPGRPDPIDRTHKDLPAIKGQA
ncbi:MAG TPA: DUF222 domain-containing protein, partial [Nocardioidaceae bacterium]|nr:DUF222 domain-containing protein [Nocardioidaceae bacterium]